MTIEEQDGKEFERTAKQRKQAGYYVDPSAKFWFIEGRRTLREQQQEWHLKHHKDPFTGIAG